MAAVNKFQYKIRDKRDGRYISMGYSSKATWMRKGIVADHIKELVNNQRYSIEDLEVAIFPLKDPITVTAASFMIDVHRDRESKKTQETIKNERREQITLKIFSYFKGYSITIDSIEDMVKEGNKLHPMIQTELENLFKALKSSSK